MLYKFLVTEMEQVEPTQCHAASVQAAELVLDNIDIRSFDYHGELGTLRFNMHAKHLALPHQTQFVESAVKEAKLVSSTDRSEQLRSCYATIRSATPLGKADKNANAEKIKAIIRSAALRASKHIEYNWSQVDYSYDARFNQVVHSLAGQRGALPTGTS